MKSKKIKQFGLEKVENHVFRTLCTYMPLIKLMIIFEKVIQKRVGKVVASQTADALATMTCHLVVTLDLPYIFGIIGNF